MRISNRLPASLHPTAFSKLLEARRGGAEFLDLTVSNPTRCGFDFQDDGWRDSLASPEVLGYKADPCGSFKARSSIAAHHGCGVRPQDVVLTASTSEAYSWLFKLLCDPGDQVLVPSPSYPLFEHLANLEGIEPVQTSAYFHERWCLDLQALRAACGPRARAIVVVNPNNPTGQFLSRSEWKELTTLCAERELALLVDEVFADFALEPNADMNEGGPPAPCGRSDPTHASNSLVLHHAVSGRGPATASGSLRTALLDDDPPCPVFVLSGLSKVALLPQVKLGWILLRGKARRCLDPLAFLADQYLSVSASAQAAAETALKASRARRTQVIERALDNLNSLDGLLEAYPHLSRLPVEGGWSVLLRCPVLHGTDEETSVMRLLEATSVLVYPGSFFDLPLEGYLVLSLLTPPEIFREGLSRILPRLPVD